ncbi:MAG: mechanosensitive ion channel [Chloroflexi bacterium]|nr:mechanosensitive ion channel [Chloroflexota bacterium]
MEQFISQWGPASSTFLVRALWAFAIFLIAFSLSDTTQRAAQKNLARTGAGPNSVLFFGRVAQTAALLVGGAIALAVLGVDLSALAAILGFLAVAGTLAVQDITRNIIAGWYLLIERPFQVGDIVRVEDQEGTIENVGARTTILRNAAGDRVIVPNQIMFTSVVTQKKK